MLEGIGRRHHKVEAGERVPCVSRQPEGTAPLYPQTPGPSPLLCSPPLPAVWALTLDVLLCCLQEAAVASFTEDSGEERGQGWREEWPLK